jgi:hypothetical protein
MHNISGNSEDKKIKARNRKRQEGLQKRQK